MATVARVVVLLWVDILALYAMYVMMAYLTDVWDLSFTRAAAIVNVFWGFVLVSPLFLTYIVDTIMGNYWMLLVSSVAYSVGLGLLTMSTPPVLAGSMGNCKEYKPECIGHGQEILFYIAMPLTAFGMAGHMTSYKPFLADQLVGEEGDIDDTTFCKFSVSFVAIMMATFVAVIGLPYIKPWSIRFGIPAICTLLATVLFLSGSCSYTYRKPQGSPVAVFFRVFVAAFLKRFHQPPRDPWDLYELNDLRFYMAPRTKSLRCLDKAAIVLPTQPREEQANKTWRLCTVTEVEETKALIRVIPVWMTFIICGVVSAIGFTFFVEQLEHLNPKVGRLKLPIVVLLWFFEQAQKQLTKIYVKFADYMDKAGFGKLSPLIGIAISMIIAILCCITAAKVEGRRLEVAQRHGFVDKPEERIPMTMFWLLPQFVLLGLFNGIFQDSALSLFLCQSMVLTRRYTPLFMNSMFGIGVLGSVLSVFVVGKVSERGGKMNWFQQNLNTSRIDKYYWTLSWLMAVNFAVYLVVAVLYTYKELELEVNHPGRNPGGAATRHDDDSEYFR